MPVQEKAPATRVLFSCLPHRGRLFTLSTVCTAIAVHTVDKLHSGRKIAKYRKICYTVLGAVWRPLMPSEMRCDAYGAIDRSIVADTTHADRNEEVNRP